MELTELIKKIEKKIVLAKPARDNSHLIERHRRAKTKSQNQSTSNQANHSESTSLCLNGQLV